MRRLVLVLLVLAALESHGVAAVVSFAATGSTTVTAGTPVVFSVGMTPETLSAYDTATIVIGTNGAGIEAAISDEWQDKFPLGTFTSPDMGTYPAGLLVSSFADADHPSSGPVNLGTIAISTDGLAPGGYWTKVDYGIDWMSVLARGFDEDPLSGSASFVVVPEPASILFLSVLLAGLRVNRRI